MTDEPDQGDELLIGSLFTGYGGLDAGVQAVLGGRVAWHADFDTGPSKVLAHHWPDVPNLHDVTAVDFAAVGPVHVLTGGFPCQDVSAAGLRRGLKPGTRSGLWSEFHRAIETLRPQLVVIENVRGLLSAEAHTAGDVEPDPWGLGNRTGQPVLRALGAVLGDLAGIGYDARWYGVRAADAGAPHGRFRVFVFAWPDAADPGRVRRVEGRGNGADAGDATRGRAHPEPVGRRGADAADADGAGLERGRPVRADAAQSDDGGNRAAAAHVEGHGRDEGRAESARQLGGSHAAVSGAPAVEWGDYAPAVEQWAAVIGRPAPSPTEPSRTGSPRLSPRFVEWMMGLPAGHVTDVPDLTRNEQLKLLGNGVVPQQAELALRVFLAEHAAEQARGTA